jgi:hypothetical protein
LNSADLDKPGIHHPFDFGQQSCNIKALTHAGHLVELGGSRCQDLTADLAFLDDQILEATASLAADQWNTAKFELFQLGDLLVKVLLRVTTETAINLNRNLAEIRAELSKALEMASALIPDKQGIEELPEPANLPILDTWSVNDSFELRKPRLSFLGKKVLYQYALSEMKRKFQSNVESCLQVHRKRLNEWSQRTIADLRKAFEARAEYYRLHFNGDGTSQSEGSTKDELLSLRELTAWPRVYCH